MYHGQDSFRRQRQTLNNKNAASIRKRRVSRGNGTHTQHADNAIHFWKTTERGSVMDSTCTGVEFDFSLGTHASDWSGSGTSMMLLPQDRSYPGTPSGILHYDLDMATQDRLGSCMLVLHINFSAPRQRLNDLVRSRH